MTVSWPRPINHAENDPGFVAAFNTVEEALNAIYVGTGWRDLTGLITNGWTASVFKIRRRGMTIDLYVVGLSGVAATSDTILTVGGDWAIPDGGNMPIPTFRVNAAVTAANITSGGTITCGGRVDNMRILTSWGCKQTTWPTTLPGTAIP